MIDWITQGVTAAINAFFKGLVSAALEPVLKLLGDTLLTTPAPDSLPRVGQLWTDSWHITLAAYSLLVMVSGVLLMTYGSVQARYSLRELGPRIPLGFLAAGLSLVFAGKAVDLANALSMAVLGGGLDKESAGTALREFVLSRFVPGSSIFLVLMWGVVAAVLVALLITYVVRVALTILLIAGAPLALMCHALPLTDGVARWWWRTFGGLLAIQVAQSMALVVGIRVFLTPGNFSPFGPTRSGLVSVLVVLALMYILFKIPFWILSSVRVGHGRSFVGRIVRAAVMYRAVGLLRGSPGRAGAGRAARGGTRPSALPPASPGAPGLRPVGTRRRQAAGGPRRVAGSMSPGPLRPPGPPLFLAPHPASSPGGPAAPAAARAPGPPPMPQFQAPGQPPSAAPAPPHGPRPARAPGPAPFRPPAVPAAPHGPSAPRRGFLPASPAPARARFQPPVASSPLPPRRAAGAAPPAPLFREPVRPVPVRPQLPRQFAPPPPFFTPPPRPDRP